MAYNEKLSDRVRKALTHQKVVEEKKMMGGLNFMVNDKMCVGISKDEKYGAGGGEFNEDNDM